MEDNSAYRDLFFEETDDNLAILNQEVLHLEEDPEDKQIIDVIFRAAHTLKGMAATMGYETMAKLTHTVENLFELVKSDELTVSSDLISLIFESLDTLAEIVENLRLEDREDVDISSLVHRLELVAEGKESSEQAEELEKNENTDYDFPVLEESDGVAIRSAESSGYTLYAIGVRVEETSMMKAARAFLLISKLEQLGDFVQMKPTAEALEQGELDDSFAVYYLSKEDKETLLKHVEDCSEIEEVSIEETTYEAVTSDKEEVDMTENTDKMADEKTAVSTPKETAKKKPVAAKQTIRVDLTRLDQFMNLVSELVIHRTRLEDVSEKNQLAELTEPLTQVGRITTELQELVLQLRMQPFNVVVQRFPRMMRDLTNELGKEIQFVTEGEDTELDRTVISEIGEPLIHLLRNAADHGVEMPDEREAKGKPRMGTIKLSAYPEGNRVIISLTDDGKGLDPRALEASARKKGIDTEGMTDEQLQNLIFHPGFSTAQTVTGISGRGVGMDAVREKIASLNGKIETISEVDKGTTFRITLPLTLSIIQSLLVKVGDETFAIPQAVIDKVNVFEEKEAIGVHQNEVYQYEGKTIPLVRVNEVLGLPQKESTSQHIIIVLIGDKQYGLIVDELIHQKEIVIKKLGRELNDLSLYLGATILGDGGISLILDVTSICTAKRVLSHV
ncbi:two-component system, chemotaxis family, sensor kinase CheA [Alkalibacterium putridalgicola]|uniref:Chemotaxis protein CheA n=1 Tax=Alkalibacterium putridalgicola TaxID=426703 RepID=A0A1H7RDL2_9LACT|nr:chemotaxis protein CheA [Alkalibacterium putridalgicola]GEK88808.1 chemotaxis protein CheA [Alkalibacterium putridalgicola]SEL58105.1 two-component system, chemotaxis family, sensor kinase CheA [Alkalibacterium putridalgicola]